MNENEILEEEVLGQPASGEDGAFEEIASAIGSIVEEELAAVENPPEPPAEPDEFDAVASAVESAVEEEFSAVYPPEEKSYTGGSEESPESQPAEPVETYIPNPKFMDQRFQEMFQKENSQELPDLKRPRDLFRKKEPKELPLLDQPTETAAPKHERPTHKGRPQRKKGAGLLGIPHLIAAVIWLMIIVAIGVSLGRVIWVCAADVLAFGRENKEVTISITTDDTLEDVAAKLHENGLIHYPDLFLLYLDLTDAEEEGKITSGTFTLNTIYDYMALVTAMSPHSGSRTVIEDVLIPEGYSCRQIFALLEEKGICKASELEEYAANGELKDYWFLEGVERGDKYCLEGFLFPDTYDFYENSSPRQALEKLLGGFEYRFTEELYNQLNNLNVRLSEMMRKNGCSDSYIADNQLDLQDLLTVASLIEEETSNNSESYNIASVIYNRLTQDQAYERYLNIDAAIFYALGEHKEALTAEDLQIDSPYNTYTNAGLVPGPITNPGLASIKAALDPADTGYYYYVLDPSTGCHDFSKTYEEHAAKVNAFNGG